MAKALEYVRGPKDEYSSEEKQQYRETTWHCLSENLSSNAKVLFFPSKHGYDIPIALKFGFKEENLIACDENPAIIASGSWRKKYPRIRCYGNDLVRTIERLDKENIMLDAVVGDFCSNLCDMVFNSLSKLLTTPILNDPFVLGITLLKGRESSAIAALARMLFGDSNRTIDRISIIDEYIRHFFKFSTSVLLTKDYMSKTQTMTYSILKLYNSDIIHDRKFNVFTSPYVLKEVKVLEEMDHCQWNGWRAKRKETYDEAQDRFNKYQDKYLKRRNALQDYVEEQLEKVPQGDNLPRKYSCMYYGAEYLPLIELPTRRHKHLPSILAEWEKVREKEKKLAAKLLIPKKEEM